MKRTETGIDFDRKQCQKQLELINGPEPKTKKEKDIWNLKHLRYSIKYGSFNYRSGMIATLDRMIKELEAREND